MVLILSVSSLIESSKNLFFTFLTWSYLRVIKKMSLLTKELEHEILGPEYDERYESKVRGYHI